MTFEHPFYWNERYSWKTKIVGKVKKQKKKKNNEITQGPKPKTTLRPYAFFILDSKWQSNDIFF